MMNNKKLVIICKTYNHAPYIKDALDGFCAQMTNFPFVVVVVDDASTDGEPKVIKQYLEDHFDLDDISNVRNEETEDYVLTYARHKTNCNCYFAVYFLKYNHYQLKKNKEAYYKEFTRQVKYIAICEGDDYWITKDKLQRQVDFLDNNEEYGMIYTDYDQKNEICGTYIKAMLKNGHRPIIHSFEEHLINKAYIAPMSWLFRTEFMDLAKNYTGPKSIDGSFIFALEMFLATKIYYESSVTCVYRVHIGSTTNQTDPVARANYSQGVYETQMYYLKKYNLLDKYPSCCDYYYRSSYCLFIANNNVEMFPYIKNFFKREMESSYKFLLFYHLMRTKVGINILRFICKSRLKQIS